MRKAAFLTLLLTLCGVATAWAEFNPTPGVMYALQEKTTGLFLDILTGVDVPSEEGEQRNISLSETPCAVYFDAYDEWTWKIKNANNQYVNTKTFAWDPEIGDIEQNWFIVEEGEYIKIHYWNSYIVGNTTVGTPLFCNNSDVPLQFALVELAFVFKEKTSGLYLDIRTLGIKDADRATNNISLSSKPYPIYLENGSAAGKWKMKNANGKYVFHNPINNGNNGHWNPEIGEQSSDWIISESGDGSFTIARAADGKFLNVDTKVAGKPLYCDQGTAMQFERLNYDDVDFITGSGLGKEGAEDPYVAVKEIDADGTTTTLPVGTGWVLKIEVENPNGASHGQWGSSILATGKEPFPYKDKHNGFQLYLQSGTNGAKKLDVVFGNADHIVNNVDYKGDFKAVITYDGAGNLEVVTTNAAGTTETDTYTVTLPEITEFAYGLPEGINIKRLSIEIIEKEYTFAVGTKPDGQNVAVTYGDEAIEAGATIKESELDLGLFVATEVSGYTWEIVVDDENATITLVYTQAPIVTNPSAVVALVKRIGGDSAADEFKFVLDPSINSKQETFILGSEGDKILIKGSTLSAITTGLGWYLNNIAKVNIAWNSLNEKTVSGAAYVDLTSIELPLPAEERHVSDAKYRYYLNYCTFGYSMTSWTWKRWQQEIDWMALHGINMPLQIVGLEEVWRRFLTLEENGQRKYNYSDSEAKAFVAGPAFTAWWGMNNLEGWGGTSADGWGGVQDDAWYERQQTLATQILTLQRALGMQPVLPGFSGMVPSNFKNKTGVECNAGSWGGFTRPKIVLPSNARFAEIAADYYACLKEVMGESQYYSMDPFHEGDEANASKEAYTAIYNAMETAKSGSQWVIQQWQWYGGNQTYSLQGVPAGKLIVLDLFSDGRPEFDKYGYNGYAPQEAVFCAIPNFGGRSGLMGRLQNVTDNYFKYKKLFTTIKGIGAAPEAIEQTPVAYDLLYQLPWMNGVKPNVAEWVDNYAVARYGKDNAIVKEAWSLLRQGPLNYGADGIQGPVEDVWAARPNLEAYAASSWGSTLSRGHNIPAPENTYNAERRQMLIDAVYKLIGQEDELALTAGSVYESNYLYDLVEFGGGVMADYAHYLLLGIKAAKNAAGANFATDATYIARRDAFLQLILDMDAFRGTNLNFRLGKWTQEARDAAGEVTGAKTETADWYEYNNARTIITTWGDEEQNGDGTPSNGLKDYSYRSWQGLLKDYYYPRWEYYFKNGCTHPDGNAKNYFFFEWNWAHGMTHQVGDTQKSTTRLAEGAKGYSYSRTPKGNTVEKAVELLGKYTIPVTLTSGTYYAYQYLDNDLTTSLTIDADVAGVLDLSPYFSTLKDSTISFISDFADGTPTKIDNINISPTAATGSKSATIELSNKTRISFTVNIRRSVPKLELDGWQFECRIEPEIVGNLADGAKPENGKRYYIAAYTKSGSEYYSRYLYDNGGTLATNTTADLDNSVWTCIVNNDGTYSFQNASGKYLANDGNHYLSIGATPATYRFEDPVAKGSTLVNAADYTGGKYMVTNSAGTAFNRYSEKGNDGSWSSDYVFTELKASDVVILTSVRQNGAPDLVIPETVEIFGEQCKIVGFNNNLFNNNKDLQTISLPSTFEFFGENALFAQSFTGNGKTQIFNVDIKNNEGWTITMDVVRTGDLTGWGACLLASGSVPTKDDDQNYAEGFQLYLQCTANGADRDKLIIKTKTQVNDNWYFDDVYQESKFTVVINYNGAQQLSVNVLKADGTNATNHEGNQAPIVFTGCTIQDITQLCTNIQDAITSHFVIDKGYPFEGCTNLTSITVADGNPNYRSIDGILYSKDAQTLVRIPEGKPTATISHTVTTVGYGAAVNIAGPITFASNPEFMLGAVDFATSLHLALDDANGIDFNTTNANTYAQVSYTRQLPDDVYGSIILPFTPLADVLDNYEFYEFRSAVGDELTFSFVEFPVANTPYIYREATASRPAMQAGITTIENPASLITSNDTWQTVGTYTTHSVACVGGDAHYYGISANDNHKMYHVTGTIKAKPFRAYFKNTDTSSAAIPSFTIRLRGKDETTVIDSTLIDREYNGDVYDLTGRRVANPTKGIYIVNGKKVVVK